MSRFAGRKLDAIWFAFCVFHLPISLLLDCQSLYPPALVPAPLKEFLLWSAALTRDPILLGAARPEFGWLRSFFWLEAVFQIPCFVIGAWGLYYNDKRVYPLLIAYGASTATTLLPCLQIILFPTLSSITQPPHTTAEIMNLLSEYVPFLVIPLGMAVDMGWRVVRILGEVDGGKKRV
ncbi:hypothetical protein I350_06495 [Cryptococcus amylolentus CBS 6273]|uniref:Efficient mitochondria targeting-associated protein 19 n=1 Tax=Cryptococcus amylolentus CBS 6273 TaxID=1296118 RepID=A0A1E3JLB8_9TREE|nr:hypothetical protein I350_06495 [Cryptococcus amylolentus CBS 6273]